MEEQETSMENEAVVEPACEGPQTPHRLQNSVENQPEAGEKCNEAEVQPQAEDIPHDETGCVEQTESDVAIKPLQSDEQCLVANCVHAEATQHESIALDKPKRQRKKKEPKDYDTLTSCSMTATSPSRARIKSPTQTQISPARGNNPSPGRSSPGRRSATHSPGRSSPGRSSATHSPGRGPSSPGRSRTRSPGRVNQSPSRNVAVHKDSDTLDVNLDEIPKGSKSSPPQKNSNTTAASKKSRKRKLPFQDGEQALQEPTVPKNSKSPPKNKRLTKSAMNKKTEECSAEPKNKKTKKTTKKEIVDNKGTNVNGPVVSQSIDKKAAPKPKRKCKKKPKQISETVEQGTDQNNKRDKMEHPENADTKESALVIKAKKPPAKKRAKNLKVQKDDLNSVSGDQAEANSTEALSDNVDGPVAKKPKKPRKKKTDILVAESPELQDKKSKQSPKEKAKKKPQRKAPVSKSSVNNSVVANKIISEGVTAGTVDSDGVSKVCAKSETADSMELNSSAVTLNESNQTNSGTIPDNVTITQSNSEQTGGIEDNVSSEIVQTKDTEEATEGSENRVFQCTQCTYKAKKKVSLRRHMTVHGVFQCAHCEFVAEKNDAYDEHMKDKHPSRCGRKLCKKCNVLFRTDEIETHEKECDGEKKKWTCSECNKEFKFLCAMRSHYEKWHTNSEKTCSKCDFVTDSSIALRKHDLAMHRKVVAKEKLLIKCKECDKVLSSDSSVKQHMKIHEGQEHPCPKCAKVFKTPRSLQNHVKVHEISKVIPCEVDGCTKLFKNQKVMEIHRKRCHEKEPKRFKCNYANCEQKFYTKYHLKRHEIMHTGERNYKCSHPDCTKAFHHAENLKVHIRSHNNINCPLCRRTFKEKESLQVHLKVHENAKSRSKKKRAKPSSDAETSSSQPVSTAKKESPSDSNPSEGLSLTTETLMASSGDVEPQDKVDNGPHDVYDFDSDDEKVDIAAISMRPSPTKVHRLKGGIEMFGTLPLSNDQDTLHKSLSEGKKKKKSKKKKSMNTDKASSSKGDSKKDEGTPKPKIKKKRPSKKKLAGPEESKENETEQSMSREEGSEKPKKSKKKSDKKHKGEKSKEKKNKGEKSTEEKDHTEKEEKTKKKKSRKKKDAVDLTDSTIKSAEGPEGKKKKSKKKKSKKQKSDDGPETTVDDQSQPPSQAPTDTETMSENHAETGPASIDEDAMLPVLLDNSLDIEQRSPPPSPTPDYLDDRKHGFFSPRPEQTFQAPITTPAYKKQVGQNVYNTSTPELEMCSEEMPPTNENDSCVLESPMSEMTECEVNDLALPSVPGASPGDGHDDNDGHSDFVAGLSPTIKDINGQDDEMLNDIAKQVEAESAIGDADDIEEMPPSNYNSSIHTTPPSVQPPLSVQPPSVPPPQEVPVITSHTTRVLEEQGITPMLSRYEGEAASRDLYQHPPLSNSSSTQQQHHYMLDQQPLSVRSHPHDFSLHEAPHSVHSQPPCLTEDQARTPRSDSPPIPPANKYYIDSPYPPSVYHSHRVPSVPPSDTHMVSDLPPTPSSVPSEPTSRYSDPMSHASSLYRQDSQGCPTYAREPMPPVSSANYSSPPQSTYIDPHTPGIVNNKEEVPLPVPGVPDRSNEPMYLPSRPIDVPTPNTETVEGQNLPVTTCSSSTSVPFSSDSLPRDLFGQYFQDATGSMPLTHPPISQDQRGLSTYPSGQQQSSLPTLPGTNTDYFRRAPAPFIPGSGYPSVTESLVPPPPQHWMSSQEERSRHWGQPSPILPIPSELDSASPLARNPYTASRPADYSFNTTSSGQFNKQGEASYPSVSQSIANATDRPTYDMASAYMNSRTFNPNYTGTMPPPPPSTSTQKQLEEVYRRAAHITDYRTLSQAAPPSMADMYSRMAVPGLGLDKYYYPRDAMFRSQHLSGPPNPFMPQANSAQMAYTDRDYSRNPIYSQHTAYGFMGEKQYLASNKLPPTLPGLQERPMPAEYLQSPAAAAAAMGDPHIQDPYRRSVIYNMMSRYF